MKTIIVLIPLKDNHNARKQCENLEDIIVPDGSEERLKAQIIGKIDDDTYDLSGIELWEMTDFMDLVNNECFIQSKFFMTYVRVDD